MRTPKGLVSLLVLALVAAAAVGAEPRLSNTKTASCMVRITADAGILALNPDIVEGLVLSSAVAGKAAREVLELDADTAASVPDGILIDWLSETLSSADGRPMPSQAGPEQWQTYEDEMIRQMEAIYGQEYRRQMELSKTATPEKKDQAEDERNAGSSRPDRPSDRNRSADTQGDRTPGRSAGGYGSGMGGGGGYGRGIGGGGGMAMGGMAGRGRMMAGYGTMMGGGGGMMGGMYGMGMGGAYGMPVQPAPRPGMQQSVTIRLSVSLPDIEFAADTEVDAIKPAAAEFMSALVDNLRATLQDAYEEYAKDLGNLLRFAESRRDDVSYQFKETRTAPSPEKRFVEEQLEEIIDLSMLSPEMPFSEAIEILRNSVEPPLNIAVLWKDLMDTADIEPTRTINMDGLSSIKLGTALEVLLQAVAGGFAELTHDVRDGVIVVGTVDTLEVSQEPATPVSVEIDGGALHSRNRELAREIQNLELDLAGWEARRMAIQEQIARAEVESERKLAGDQVTQELERIVQAAAEKLALTEDNYRKNLVAITAIEDSREQLARARIEMARRREELGRSVGGGQIDKFGSELSRMAVDTAEKRAQLDILRQQLEAVRGEVARASRFDPQAARIRLAKESLEIAERRVAELKMHLANLQPPTVTMIGSN